MMLYSVTQTMDLTKMSFMKFVNAKARICCCQGTEHMFALPSALPIAAVTARLLGSYAGSCMTSLQSWHSQPACSYTTFIQQHATEASKKVEV